MILPCQSMLHKSKHLSLRITFIIMINFVNWMTCNKLIIELKEAAKTPHVKQTHKNEEKGNSS